MKWGDADGRTGSDGLSRLDRYYLGLAAVVVGDAMNGPSSSVIY